MRAIPRRPITARAASSRLACRPLLRPSAARQSAADGRGRRDAVLTGQHRGEPGHLRRNADEQYPRCIWRAAAWKAVRAWTITRRIQSAKYWASRARSTRRLSYDRVRPDRDHADGGLKATSRPAANAITRSKWSSIRPPGNPRARPCSLALPELRALEYLAPGGVTPAQIKYLEVPSSYGITAKEYIVDASVTADLGKYGHEAARRIDRARASTWVPNIARKAIYFNPDYIFQNGFASGGNGAQNGRSTADSTSRKSFTEARVPIMSDKPGAYALSPDAGYRYSSYTSGFSTNTYKLASNMRRSRSALRAGYNRAVRAPSVGDLFSPAVIGAGGTADPCWGAVAVARAVYGTSWPQPGILRKHRRDGGRVGHIPRTPRRKSTPRWAAIRT